jgi:hypothetical protein
MSQLNPPWITLLLLSSFGQSLQETCVFLRTQICGKGVRIRGKCFITEDISHEHVHGKKGCYCEDISEECRGKCVSACVSPIVRKSSWEMRVRGGRSCRSGRQVLQDTFPRNCSWEMYILLKKIKKDIFSK